MVVKAQMPLEEKQRDQLQNSCVFGWKPEDTGTAPLWGAALARNRDRLLNDAAVIVKRAGIDRYISPLYGLKTPLLFGVGAGDVA